jgi:hypothetical protein
MRGAGKNAVTGLAGHLTLGLRPALPQCFSDFSRASTSPSQARSWACARRASALAVISSMRGSWARAATGTQYRCYGHVKWTQCPAGRRSVPSANSRMAYHFTGTSSTGTSRCSGPAVTVPTGP